MRVVEILIVIIVIGVGVLALKHLADKTSVPKDFLLTSSTSGWQASDFVLPKGGKFNIVLGLPEGVMPVEGQYSGEVTLLNSSNIVADFPFDATRSTPASWLSDHKLAAYILTWPTNRPPVRLDDVLSSGISYHLIISFSNALPDQGAIWLTYLQDWKDKN